MSFKNQCDLPTGAVAAACCLPNIDLTPTLPELMLCMAEGRVTFDGQTVKSLNHLKKLYSEWLEKQKY